MTSTSHGWRRVAPPVGDSAGVRWRELPGRPDEVSTPPRWWALTGPAVLAIVGVLFYLDGRRKLPALLGAAALVLLVTGLTSVRFRVVAVRVQRAVASAVGPVLAWVLLLPVYVLVLVPASLLLRVAGIRPLERGTGRGSPSLWLSAVRPPRDTGRRMFSDQRAWRPERTGRTSLAGTVRTVGFTVVAVLAIEGMIIGGARLLSSRSEPVPELAGTGSVGPGESPALRDLPWVGDVLQETSEVAQGIVYAPFVGSTLRDHEGVYVNVEDRVRQSYQPSVVAGEKPLEIWFFGGSTMFGFDAQRDLHTIPSEFARLAEQAGIPVRVRNYGSPGYVNFQETVLLGLLTSAGQRPDLAVFYDGVNDQSLQLLNAVGGINALGDPADLGTSQQRNALFGSGAVPGGSPEPPAAFTSDLQRPYSADDVVQAVNSVYAQGMDVASAMGERHGFDAMWFWQPTLFTKQPLHPGEQLLMSRLGLDQFRFDSMAAMSDQITQNLPDNVVDISDALDATSGPVIADNVHINEEGARAVADAMFEAARPKLERLMQAG